MLPLIPSTTRRRRFSDTASRHMRLKHSIKESASRYLRALHEHSQRPVLPLAEYSQAALLPAMRHEASLRRIPESQRSRLPLWATEALVPTAHSEPVGRVLMIGGRSEDSRVLRMLFGYEQTSIDSVLDVSQGVTLA